MLVVCGGGIRCVMSARFIQEIEKRCNKNISSLFDLVAGTSSGSIVAATLTSSDIIKNAEQLLENLKNGIPKIFGDPGENVFSAKFNHTELETILEQSIEKKTLSEAKIPLIIPTFSLSNARPRIWSSELAKKDITYDLLLKDIVSASCSAPTIFPPKKLVLNNGEEIIETDGGLWANNPTELALYELEKIYPEIKKEDITMVCIGTGVVKEHTIKPLNYGISGWITELIPMLYDTATYWDGVNVSNQVNTYYIAQPKISSELNTIDNFKYIPELIKTTEKFIEDNDKLFNDIANSITK